MDSLSQDLRYAVRRLVKSPGFTAVAVLTLALGIGANSAIFSVVNGVLLKPLPFPQPEQLVRIFHVYDGQRTTMSGPNFWDLASQAQTLASAAAFSGSSKTLTGEGEPVRLDAADVSGSFFELLGVRPALGRALNSDDNRPNQPKTAVLSHDLWQQRFGGRPDIVGRRITLDGAATEVVGVMPKGFAYPSGKVLWTPTEYTVGFTTDYRGMWYLTVIGRAKPGVPLPRVTAETQAIGAQLASRYQNDNENLGFTAVPLLEATVGDVRKAVLVMLGAVGFVLLIACANVANLLLARAAARGSEMAVRTALGAGRARLVRQLLTESLLLSLLGAGLGLLLAIWGVELLIGLKPEGIPRLDAIGVDRPVIVFAISLAVLTGLVFGVFPAAHATRDALTGTLKEAGRGALTSRSGSRMRDALVIAEMALAVVLLSGAGLLIRSFTKLSSVDPGFRTDSALTFEVSLPDSRYEEQERQVAFFDQLMPRLTSIPGVRSAGGVMVLPLTGSSFVLSFQIAGRPPVPPALQPAMQVHVATSDYLSMIGVPLKRGRMFTDQDRAGSTPVVLVNEAAARQFFPGEDPLGKRITLGWGRGPGTPRAGGEVIGVIGDIKDEGLQQAGPPQLYLPYRQWPVRSMAVVLTSTVPPGSIAAAARREVNAVDPLLPVARVRTLEQILAGSVSQPRFYMTLLAIFATVALLLAAIGIFGVLSYAVVQRTREIGIRMALGARERTVVGLIVRHAMLLTVSGVVLGSLAAWWLSKWLMAGFLFATDPRDPATAGAVALTLIAVAFVAAYVPSRRATRVDPIVALRTE